MFGLIETVAVVDLQQILAAAIPFDKGLIAMIAGPSIPVIDSRIEAVILQARDFGAIGIHDVVFGGAIVILVTHEQDLPL